MPFIAEVSVSVYNIYTSRGLTRCPLWDICCGLAFNRVGVGVSLFTST